MNKEEEEAQAIAKVISRLRQKFSEVAPQEVENIVHEEHWALSGRPVRDFVPVLVEHEAKQRLRALRVPASNSVPRSP